MENDAEPCFQALMQFEVVTSVSRAPHGLGGGDGSHFRLLGTEKIHESHSCLKDITSSVHCRCWGCIFGYLGHNVCYLNVFSSLFLFVWLIIFAAFWATLTLSHRTRGLSAGLGEGRDSRLPPDIFINNCR